METLHGWGTVRWITLDLTNPQLARWPGLPRWWERLLAGRIASVEEQDANRRNRGQVTHRGYEDLAGQLRMALDRYEGVTPIHFYGVAGVILLYLCLLGPSEYFLLKRFMPRAMHITWYLLPILTGGMVATGTWLASVTQGTVVRMNQVELLDLHPQRGQLRGACWAGLFAPSARTFSLEMRVAPVGSPDALPAPSRLSWQTLSGRGLGGVDAPALVSVGHEPYELEGHDQFARLMRLSLPAASSKLLSGSWRRAWTPPAEFTQLRKGKLRDLEGTFLNVTPWELRNAYLAHGDWLYRAIDDIAPGDTVHVERLDRKHLESQLTRRKTISTGDLASPWNADDTDVARILELMLFHEAAGGESYTGLQHSPGKELDLSRCLRQGYAVLLGKVAVPLAEFQEEGKTVAADATRRWSYVRVLYPVAPASGMGSTAASAPAEETR
jgi:hypothetical protein